MRWPKCIAATVILVSISMIPTGVLCEENSRCGPVAGNGEGPSGRWCGLIKLGITSSSNVGARCFVSLSQTPQRAPPLPEVPGIDRNDGDHDQQLHQRSWRKDWPTWPSSLG